MITFLYNILTGESMEHALKTTLKSFCNHCYPHIQVIAIELHNLIIKKCITTISTKKMRPKRKFCIVHYMRLRIYNHNQHIFPILFLFTSFIVVIFLYFN